jgi:organic hydroperoxide reductase OsmC/OhrA
VVVKSAEAVAPTEKALHDAHDNCIISNSISSTVVLEPEISMQQE